LEISVMVIYSIISVVEESLGKWGCSVWHLSK
jgi:hypothetical protein